MLRSRSIKPTVPTGNRVLYLQSASRGYCLQTIEIYNTKIYLGYLYYDCTNTLDITNPWNITFIAASSNFTDYYCATNLNNTPRCTTGIAALARIPIYCGIFTSLQLHCAFYIYLRRCK